MDTTPCKIKDKNIMQRHRTHCKLTYTRPESRFAFCEQRAKYNINTQNLANLKVSSYELLFRILCTIWDPYP